MFIYWGKQIVSEKIGRRVVDVECDKCECQYCFVMTRIGSGTSSAPYGIGVGTATRSAEKKAQRDLTRLLERDTEPVPCPKCHWINDELVQGYRRGRFRQLGSFGIALGVLGTVVSLLIARIIWMSPPAERSALPYVLGGGLAASLLVLRRLLLLQYGLRALIRPNRNFPQAPKLPPGTPAAVFEDKSTGVLTPHDPGQSFRTQPQAIGRNSRLAGITCHLSVVIV